MSPKPLVSVVIPTFNRAFMIRSAIESALAQTYPNKEVIVVDDGSTDDTMSIVSSYRDVRYFLQDHRGQAAARNTGWKHAHGEYFATLDSDDVWRPDFLEKSIDVLHNNQLDFVFSNWDQERIEGGVMDFFSYDEYLRPYLPRARDGWVFLDYQELRSLYIRSCLSPSSSMVLRYSSIVHGWNEQMNIGDDWCMLLDMILNKETRAAFTTERLWLKQIRCNNLYDGRDHEEVNKLLWVKDIQTMLSRHEDVLTNEEYRFIERRYLRNLMRSAKHSLFTHSNLSESFRLFRRAMLINPFYSTKVFSELFMEKAFRSFKKHQIKDA